jgi:hypothetical protein
MTGVFAVALALTAAAACVASGAPLLLQEVLAWRGGRAASVRVRSHTCSAACATSSGGRRVAREVQLSQPTLWSEHSQRLCELRVTTEDGARYLLPVPPTQMVRPGDSFRVGAVSGRPALTNCTTGASLVLPRRLVKESSPLGSLSALPLVLVAPFALLVVFVGSLGRNVAHKLTTFDTLAGGPADPEVASLAQRSTEMLASGFTWLFAVALFSCALLFLVSSARWPRPRVVTTDGRLLAI